MHIGILTFIAIKEKNYTNFIKYNTDDFKL